MSGFGAKSYSKTYSKLGVETEVLEADPHRLILMLFDGALQSIQRAKGFLAQRNIAQKCQALSKACEIVDGGLRVSVDPRHNPEFAGRLVTLYQYVILRLLQGNLRNDVVALDEAAKILGDLRAAWIQITPGKTAPLPASLPQPAETAVRAPVRREIAAYQV